MQSINKRFPKQDAIWLYSNPKIAQQKAIQYLGSDALLIRSKTKNKKYSIQSADGKTINFGQMGYEDYTKHKDDIRRQNYLKRTSNIKGSWKDDLFSGNNLSRNILW